MKATKRRRTSKVYRLSVAELRRRFPHPRRACQSTGADLDDDYCVGGALCMAVGAGPHFPDQEHIREAVMMINKRIDWYTMNDRERDHVRLLTDEVIACNDMGRFEAAYKAIGKLLRWPRP